MIFNFSGIKQVCEHWIAKSIENVCNGEIDDHRSNLCRGDIAIHTSHHYQISRLSYEAQESCTFMRANATRIYDIINI